MAAPTQKELDTIQKFRERVLDLDLTKHLFLDMYLLRWLRAREMNLDKAEEMLRKSLAWRKENDVEVLLEWEPPADFLKYFPYQIWGYDKADSPTGLLKFGDWDVRGNAVESCRREDYLKYIEQMFEFVTWVLKEKSRVDNRPITQFNIIIDMANYSYRQIASISTVETILESVKRFEANHPETLKSAYVINAPRIFSVLFSLVKPLMTARTLSKVQVFSSDEKWRAELLEKFHKDQITTQFGGTNTKNINNFSMILNEYYDDFFGSKSKKNEIDDEVVTVTVEAGEKLSMEFDIEESSTVLNWWFKCDDYDLGFSILNQGSEEVLGYQRKNLYEGSLEIIKPGKCVWPISDKIILLYGDIQTFYGLKMTILWRRFYGESFMEEFRCFMDALDTLVFDNSYSRMRSKTLHYSISISPPAEIHVDSTQM